MKQLNILVSQALVTIQETLVDAEAQRREMISGISKITRKRTRKTIEESPETEEIIERVDRLILFQQLLRNIRMNLLEFKKSNLKLRLNQLNSIRKLIEFLQAEGQGGVSGYIKQPTGAGKTVLFGVLVRLCSVPTLILVPKTNLLTQTKRELVEVVGIPEEEIGIVGGGHKEFDKPIKIATYHSHRRRIFHDAEYRTSVGQCQLVVCDEAHRALGDVTQDSLEELEGDFDNLLTIEELEDENEVLANLERYTPARALKLGFTATPQLKDKHVEQAFGPLIAEEKYADLIKAKILVPYRIVQADGTILDADIEGHFTEEREIEVLHRENAYRNLLGKYSDMLHAFRSTKKKNAFPIRGIAFCVRIDECDIFAAEAQEFGLRARVITSRETKGMKLTQAEAFLQGAEQQLIDQELDLIITVGKLAEGWDFPPGNAAIWARACKSPALIIQGIGRTGRNHTDDRGREKEFSYVFETKWKLKGKSRASRPLSLATAFYLANENVDEICKGAKGDKIDFEVPEQSRKAWDESFERLCSWRVDNPNIWPQGNAADLEIRRLGHWFNIQKQIYKRNELSQDQIERLEKLGADWDVRDTKWNQTFENLKTFRQQNSDRWPVDTSEDADEVTLRGWCVHMRSLYREGKLSLKRIAQLESIGFLWDPRDEQWSNTYKKLDGFVKSKKKWPSAKSNDEEEKKLAEWCQSKRYAKRKNQLSNEQISDLDSLSFDWEPTAKHWYGMFEKVKVFIGQNSRWPANGQRKSNEEIRLAKWLSGCRAKKRKGILDVDKVQMLDNLGFYWEPYEQPDN